MFDWLGLNYLEYKNARVIVNRLGLKSKDEWKKYIKGKLLDKQSKLDNILMILT